MSSKTHTMIWGSAPSTTCLKLWEYISETENQHFLIYGIGDGRNAKFLASQDFEVVAIDSDAEAVENLKKWAIAEGKNMSALVGNLDSIDIGGPYDVILSVGALNRISPDKRDKIFAQMLEHTKPNGYNAISVFVDKPFVRKHLSTDVGAFFKSGELMSYYHQCNISWTNQELFRGSQDDLFCVDRIIARKLPDGHMINPEDIIQTVNLV
jgi:tellurite methyltransferase